MHQHRRLSMRGLKREFELDERVDIQQIGERDDKAIAWMGDKAQGRILDSIGSIRGRFFRTMPPLMAAHDRAHPG